MTQQEYMPISKVEILEVYPTEHQLGPISYTYKVRRCGKKRTFIAYGANLAPIKVRDFEDFANTPYSGAPLKEIPECISA